MEASGQLHPPAAKSLGTHWIGGWVDPRADLDTVCCFTDWLHCWHHLERQHQRRMTKIPTKFRITNKPNSSMEQSSSWEANGHSPSQQIPCLLYNPKVNHRVYKSSPLVSGWARWIHFTSFHTISLRSILILSSHLCLGLSISLPYRVSNRHFVSSSRLFHSCYMHCLSHPLTYGLPNNIWWSVKVMKLLNMQSSPATCNFLPLWSTYCHEHPVLNHPQSIFFP